MTFGGSTFGGTAFGSTTAAGGVEASAALAGSADLLADPTQHNFGAAALAGSGALSATARIFTPATGAAALAGSADVTATPQIGLHSAATLAGSADLLADTGFVPAIPSTGWHVVVIHPATRRRIHPDVLDEPQYNPGPNFLPEIRVPVRRAPEWLEEQFDSNPPMQVYLDGEQLPIDEVVDVEVEQGRTVLVGEGGTELRQRVQTEYRSERRHIAASQLVSSETSYVADIDTPSVETLTDETLQDPTTTPEIEADIRDLKDTDPIDTSGDQVQPHQSGHFLDPEFDYTSRQGFGPNPNSTAQGGSTFDLAAVGDFIEFEVSFDYTVPAPSLNGSINEGARHWLRGQLETDDSAPTFIASVDGETVQDFTPSSLPTSSWGFVDNIGQIDTDFNYQSYDQGQTVTFRLEVVGETANQDPLQLDCVWVGDARYSYTFDTSDSDSNDTIAGPEEYPGVVTVTGVDEVSPFSVTDVAAALTIDDTSGAQRLQVSNDRGETWKPDDGTEDNTASVDVDFSSPGSAGLLRVDLVRYSPNGTRSTSPNTGYDVQTISDWTLTADIDLELLLIDERFDAALVDVLNDIAGEQFVWRYEISGGTPTIAWTQPGERIATRDPDLSDAVDAKRLRTWDTVAVKGSNTGVSGETFTASATFQDLAESNLLAGSEVVYDAASGVQFSRGADYEIDYSDGEIREVAGGDLETSSSYSIDYKFGVRGSHSVGDTVGDTLVREVPGVVNDRQAEQIAYAIAEVDPAVEKPRYESRVTIPRVGPEFSPIDAYEFADRDLPDAATPLSIRGDPQLTPRGVEATLGSATPLQEALAAISEQVSQVSKRS